MNPETTTSAAQTTERPPTGTPEAPRWVRRVAALSALTPVPSSLWRLPLIVGVSMGLSPAMMDDLMGVPLWLRALYLIGLGVLSDGLAYLTLGLVRWWGETFPGWIPLVGGQRVPTWFAASLGISGGLAATYLAVLVARGWTTEMGTLGDWTARSWLMTACYAPLLLWGPTVLIVTADFVRRRRARDTAGRTVLLGG
ncbi:hypothetical protein [Nocardioides panzhihuensis]|uniref:Uncharacterized protein n=1 Tax=Nocardioides panzhihuensis TaxID=860243 RepID=A0A7Z0DP75_9ACTN|nr:hypothetical protein [Nocardioides panzhihuensis]NYI78871.1 hypothetical protein [Nocardioides panzhihuensis]